MFHTNVLKKYCPHRPWGTVVEMNEGLIRNWNSVVSSSDIVYCIGDFSLAFRPVEVYTRRLNGIKILVSGNHDFTHRSHKKSRKDEGHTKWVSKYLECGWDKVVMQEETTLEAGQEVILNHLPYLNEDGEGQRFVAYRARDEGKLLLCGHVHQSWLWRRTKRGTPMINVGVDCNPLFRPWSEEELCKLVEKEGLK